jgi:hypothetical protein
MKQKLLIICGAIAFLLLIVTACGLVWYMHNHKPTPAESGSNTSSKKYKSFTITIKNSRLVGAPNYYVVNPGVGLEFHIISDKTGKVGAPTNPPETITFTKLPLVFHLDAPAKAGKYPITYEADGSNKVISLGAVIVKAVKK